MGNRKLVLEVKPTIVGRLDLPLPVNATKVTVAEGHGVQALKPAVLGEGHW